MIVCSGSLVWLFSPALDAIKLTLPGGCFICPFVVIDHTYLGVTTVVAPGLMLDNLLPFPNAESLPFSLHLLVCVIDFEKGLAILRM